MNEMKRYIRPVLLILTAAVALSAPAVYADGKDSSPKTRAEERRALREAEKKAKEELKKAKKAGDQDAIAQAEAELADIELAKKGGNTSVDLDKEFNALKEAQALLAEVKDEKSAKDAAKKICTTFGRLPAPITMSDHDIEQWSIEQNKVSAQMERLRSQPYFESSGLQDAWTNVTDPYSRKRAQRDKSR